MMQLERESGAAAKPSPTTLRHSVSFKAGLWTRVNALRRGEGNGGARLYSPHISHGAGAGVGGGVGGELAVEFRKQRYTVGEAKLGARRGERGVLRERRAVDDEARAGKRLEHRHERRVAHPVVRPCPPC